MKPIVLEVSKRDTSISKGKLDVMRKEGLVPGVIYGPNLEPISFIVKKKPLLAIVWEHGLNVILTVKIEGEAPIQAMIKDVQKHPITGLYWHLDLAQISLTETIKTSVPVVFEGEPKGVKEGGFIQYGDTTIEVECLPSEIPHNISLDISDLGIDDKIVVADLKLSASITILGEPEQVIISISGPTEEEPEETEVAEVVTEEKKED